MGNRTTVKQILIRVLNWLRGFLAKQISHYDVKLPYAILIVIALILVVVGINLFVELTDVLKTETLATFDQSISDYIISYRSDPLTDFFRLVTNFGDVFGYLAVLVFALFFSFLVLKSWKHIIQIVLVLALASLSNLILKRAIDRARPGIEHLVSVETLSYPSGHAMSAMAFYGFTIYLLLTFKFNKILKVVLVVFLIVLIINIGISRIYLGVHYPSDVIGGFIAGFIWVIFCIVIFNAIAIFRKGK